MALSGEAKTQGRPSGAGNGAATELIVQQAEDLYRTGRNTELLDLVASM
jgi:hypothetical protein